MQMPKAHQIPKCPLSSSFMRYAMMTILSRALPDMRDGLKPVHRRILYAMHKLGLQPDTPFRKCARVVGEVLGKYHPHGDVAVYDAMVRMAQDFVMSKTLVNGHGNFGSMDNDPPAAMRYTEAKLSAFSRDSLLLDIAKDTVDFLPNFDESETEPVVLPARVPILLLNGASGIAVGMATNIPPHNLGELVDGTIALIKNPNLPEPELLELVPGPDFPTGGVIVGSDGISKLYTTGHGSVVVRAVINEETIELANGRSRTALVISELPYLSNKAGIVEKIAKLCDDKKLEGVSSIRDESDSEGMRIVLELKNDAVPSVVTSNLYQKTSLQTSFAGNFVGVGSNGLEPIRFNLKQALLEFINFRHATIRRRASFELSKEETRAHLVEGMLLVRKSIDKVVDLIMKSKNSTVAKEALMAPTYNLSSVQADAVLAMRLSQLTGMEEEKLRNEYKQLQERIAELRGLLDDDTQVSAMMRKELEEIKSKHAVARRTMIDENVSSELHDETRHPKEQVAVITTRNGYVKRMKVSEFQSQNRGTSGKAGTRLSDGDAVEHFFTCSSHDTVLFISEKGVAHTRRAYEIPYASRIARGTPLQQILPITPQDRISGIVPVTDFNCDLDLIMLTRKGWVKKTPLKAFSRITARGLVAINIEEGDRLLNVHTCLDTDSIIIGTRNGLSLRFNTSELRPTGRASRGVTAIALKGGDELVDMDVIPATRDTSYLLVVTSGGYGKRVQLDEFRVQKRGGVGVIAMKFKAQKAGEPSDTLASMRACEDGNEVMLITGQGTLVRLRADQISLQKRSATGVLVQRFDGENFLQSAAIVPKEFEESPALS
eukprot:jgi/Bigna1/57852/fgenesh1_pm.32_\